MAVVLSELGPLPRDGGPQVEVVVLVAGRLIDELGGGPQATEPLAALVGDDGEQPVAG